MQALQPCHCTVVYTAGSTQGPLVASAMTLLVWCRQEGQRQQFAWLCHTDSLLVKQQWAQLLSSIAGMYEGRRYLSLSITALVQWLCRWLTLDEPETDHMASHLYCLSLKLPIDLVFCLRSWHASIDLRFPGQVDMEDVAVWLSAYLLDFVPCVFCRRQRSLVCGGMLCKHFKSSVQGNRLHARSSDAMHTASTGNRYIALVKT